jgi:hypothetical protein
MGYLLAVAQPGSGWFLCTGNDQPSGIDVAAPLALQDRPATVAGCTDVSITAGNYDTVVQSFETKDAERSIAASKLNALVKVRAAGSAVSGQISPLTASMEPVTSQLELPLSFHTKGPSVVGIISKSLSFVSYTVLTPPT